MIKTEVSLNLIASTKTNKSSCHAQHQVGAAQFFILLFLGYGNELKAALVL